MKSLQELKIEKFVFPESIDSWETLYSKIRDILEVPNDFEIDFRYTELDTGKTGLPFEAIYLEYFINSWIIKKYKLDDCGYCNKIVLIWHSNQAEPMSYHGSLSDEYRYRWFIDIEDVESILNMKSGYEVYTNASRLYNIVHRHEQALIDLNKISGLFPILI